MTKILISLPKSLVEQLAVNIPASKRSQFISELIKQEFMRRDRDLSSVRLPWNRMLL